MSRRISRHQRGSALVLSIFILFAMLAMGMLAMRSATQNISGSGNLRLTKQARYVAETGLYHAITLMNRQGGGLLPLRDGVNAQGSFLVVESPRGERAVSDVLVKSVDGATIDRVSRPAPPVFSEGPSPLGPGGDASGLVPSYQVEVSGFQQWACPPGFDEMALREQGEGCCLMHFEARGVIAGEVHPSDEDLNVFGAADRFGEHRLKAGVVLGPFSLRGCGP
jgi:hypothetical protein